MVRIVTIEEEISAHYGLPLTFNFSEIFQELGIIGDFKLVDIWVCIDQLERAAKDYFNKPVVSDLQLLEIAQQSQIDLEYVLPELTLKLLGEPYYRFCYYFLFLPKKITAEKFLKELKIVVENDCSIMLNKTVQKRLVDFRNDNDYLALEALGLIYLNVFLKNYHKFDTDKLEYLENGLPF